MIREIPLFAPLFPSVNPQPVDAYELYPLHCQVKLKTSLSCTKIATNIPVIHITPKPPTTSLSSPEKNCTTEGNVTQSFHFESPLKNSEDRQQTDERETDAESSHGLS